MRYRQVSWALLVICAAVFGFPKISRADSIPAELFVATVTEVNSAWRVEVNNFPFYELQDVTLTFNYVGGFTVYHFADILAGKFVDTPPFDPSLQFVSLTLQYIWPNQTFKIGPFDTFTANSLVNSASENTFPPPLDVFLKGTDSHVVPEPTSVVLLGTGIACALAARRKRRARPAQL